VHTLLARQIRNCFGEIAPSDPQYAAFIAVIDAAYQAADADRALLEHSIELASAELLERNAQLERDIESIKRLELELFQAEKLRAVGQLAAGIAHEINTPIQYVGDSVSFLKGAFTDITEFNARALALCSKLEDGEATRDSFKVLRSAAEELDLDYLRDETPTAFERTLDGIRRVAQIVAAMKELGRIDQSEKVSTDLARCIENALTVVRNQLKYVADVQVALEPVPPVSCHPAELSQVLLNLLVNAAHAIEERCQKENLRGCVRVVLHQQGPDLVISVSDNGCGIPDALKGRIFEPFFTTKAVGKGTGQGLAISRTIMEKQGGSLSFESKVNEGTTFFVKLPLGAKPPDVSELTGRDEGSHASSDGPSSLQK
jgi:two-component system, NtrC family, sensor kinase